MSTCIMEQFITNEEIKRRGMAAKSILAKKDFHQNK